MRQPQGLLTALTLVLGGCDGVISSGGDRVPPPPTAPGARRRPEAPAVRTVSTAPMARLSSEELRNTLFDLFGEAAVEGLTVADPLEGVVRTPISGLEAIAQLQRAELIAARVSQSAAVRRCQPSSTLSREACTQTLVEGLGLRLFRRPLTADETARYTAAAAQAETFDEGLLWVASAMLASPKFLYRIEQGDPAREQAGVRPTTSFELASRLSYALWHSAPDAVLLERAAHGELTTQAQVQDEARRMLGDERARRSVEAFHLRWLGADQLAWLHREPHLHPEFDTALVQQWRDETTGFVAQAVLEEDRTLPEMMQARYTLASPRVAALYGAPPPDAAGRVTLPERRRAGFLGQSTFLAGRAPSERSAALHRGAFIARNLLCQQLPPPPAVVPPIPPPDPKLSQRQQLEALTSNAGCSTCHSRFNAFGFALENLDAIGAWRDLDLNDQPVNAEVVLPAPLAGRSVSGPVELADALASSQTFLDCYVDQWLAYLAGRPGVDVDADAYSYELARYEFQASGGDVRNLLVQLVGSDLFRYLNREGDAP